MDPLCLHGEVVLKSSQGVTLNGFPPKNTSISSLYFQSYELFGSALSILKYLQTNDVEVDRNYSHSYKLNIGM